MQSSARKLRGRDGTVQSPTRYFISIVRMYPFPSSPGKSPFLSSHAPRFARPCASRAMQSSARKLRGRDGTVQSPTRYFISIVRMYLSHPLRGNHRFSPLLHHGSPGRVLPVPCSHPHASLEGETVPCSHRHVTSLVSCECTFPILSGEITISLLSCTTVRQAVCFPCHAVIRTQA